MPASNRTETSIWLAMAFTSTLQRPAHGQLGRLKSKRFTATSDSKWSNPIAIAHFVTSATVLLANPER